MSSEQVEHIPVNYSNIMPSDQASNMDEVMNEDNSMDYHNGEKKHRSSLKATLKNKVMQIFKHSNNENASSQNHDMNTQSSSFQQQAPSQFQSQDQSHYDQHHNGHEQHEKNGIDNNHKNSYMIGTKASMHGARTKERLASLAAMQKSKPKENRHSLGIVPTATEHDGHMSHNHQCNDNNHNYNNNNNNNNNNLGNNNNDNDINFLNKRYSLDVNLKKQEQQRKMLQQKAKEQQRKLMQQTIEEIKEQQQQQQQQPQSQSQSHNNHIQNNNNGILEDNVFPESYDYKPVDESSLINEQQQPSNQYHNHFKDKDQLLPPDEMVETKSAEKESPTDHNQNNSSNGHYHQHNNSSIMEVDSSNNTPNGSSNNDGLNLSTQVKKKKKVTYRLSNEKFVVFDYYQITKILGQGAYAVVAEAIDKRNGQKVAIKKNKGVFSSLSDSKRILREIKLLLHFDHDNIISLIGVIPPELHEREDFEEVYLVMPRMETTLSRVIRSRQSLTEKHKQYFIYQLLCGLRYIHSAEVLHRDLKPENILINGADCKLKITDFGLARGVLKETDQKLTEYVVTRWYRAPEVMCSSRRYDEGVDVWSVGCIMAELFLRKPFFPGSNHIEQLKLIFHYLGTPDDLEWIKTPDAKRWVSQMPKKPPKDFKQIMTGASDIALDLMLQMLTIDPRNRISVNKALNHPWLKSLKKDSDEVLCEKFDLSFEFEASINTLFGVRHVMYEELKSFDKNNSKKLEKRNKMSKAKSTKVSHKSSNGTLPQPQVATSTK